MQNIKISETESLTLARYQSEPIGIWHVKQDGKWKPLFRMPLKDVANPIQHMTYHAGLMEPYH